MGHQTDSRRTSWVRISKSGNADVVIGNGPYTVKVRVGSFLLEGALGKCELGVSVVEGEEPGVNRCGVAFGTSISAAWRGCYHLESDGSTLDL